MSKINLFSLTAAIIIGLNGCTTTPTTSVPTATKTHTNHQNHNETKENKNVSYMTSLALMKGHLLVAKELIDQKKLDQAEPHTGHPVEEHYGDIEEELSARNVPEFKTTLTKLHDLIKSQSTPDKINREYTKAIAAIDKAIAAIPQTERQSSPFILSVFNNLLRVAKAEYKAGVSDGKIVELIEYQDSRGFVLYANTLYEQIAPQLKEKKPQTATLIASTLTELNKAWPSVNPPDKATKTPEEVAQLVTKIQENSTTAKQINN